MKSSKFHVHYTPKTNIEFINYLILKNENEKSLWVQNTEEN